VAQENIKGHFPLNFLTIEELDIFLSKCPYKEKDEKEDDHNLETGLRNIRIKRSIRRMGSTPTRIAQHQS